MHHRPLFLLTSGQMVGPCIGPQDSLFLGLSTAKEPAACVYLRGPYYCRACLCFARRTKTDDAAIIAKEMAKSRLEHYLQNTSWRSDTN